MQALSEQLDRQGHAQTEPFNLHHAEAKRRIRPILIPVVPTKYGSKSDMFPRVRSALTSPGNLVKRLVSKGHGTGPPTFELFLKNAKGALINARNVSTVRLGELRHWDPYAELTLMSTPF